MSEDEEVLERHVTFTLPVDLEAAEQIIIMTTIAYYKGDKRQASVALGISLKTIYNKLEKYRVQSNRKSNDHRVPRTA